MHTGYRWLGGVSFAATARAALVAGTGLLLTCGGCPTPPASAVDARITASSTTGGAPLTVVLTASSSTSSNPGPLTYAWDLGDGSVSDEVSFTHTYARPGRYIVVLRVTDSAGQRGTTSIDIRVRGVGVTAVIVANPTSGPAPLVVQFDGTTSSAPDDTILDYYWDFNDGSTSRFAKPSHAFMQPGSYEVSLRVVTAGGLEATTTKLISVGVRTGSLLFNGSMFATLPLASSSSYAALTFETWIKPDSDGGTVASVGSGAITLDVMPGTNTLRVQINGSPIASTVTGLAGSWRHLAVTYSSGAGGACVVYVDGAPLVSTAASGPLTVGGVVLGVGYRGRIGEVRMWNTARTASEISAAYRRRVTPTPTGLVGYWRLDEGSGQVLDNRGIDGTDGMLGSSTAVEGADPAWSTEGPPLA